jgi:hypothetical protein
MPDVTSRGRPAQPVRCRYAIRQIEDRQTVLDIWTGEPVVIGMAPQTDLDPKSADELLDYLKRRALRGWDIG